MTTHPSSQSTFYERFGEPCQEPVKRVDGDDVSVEVPTYGIAPAFLACRPQEVTLSESVSLVPDFGEAYMPSASGSQRTHCHAPLRGMPLEAHLVKGDLGFPTGIWALACVICEVVGGSGPLFGTGYLPSEDNLRKDWVHVLGRLLDEWWDA